MLRRVIGHDNLTVAVTQLELFLSRAAFSSFPLLMYRLKNIGASKLAARAVVPFSFPSHRLRKIIERVHYERDKTYG